MSFDIFGGFPSMMSEFFPSPTLSTTAREFFRPVTAQRTGREGALLSTPVRGVDLQTDNWWRPRTDLFLDEENNEIRVEVELPGISLENINLECDGDCLIVSSYKAHSRKEDRGLFYLVERHFGNFYRRLDLPLRVDPDKVQAHIKDGVLKICLPILSSIGRRTKIQIAAAEKKQQPLSAGGEGPEVGGMGQQQQQQQQVQQQQQQQPQQQVGTQGTYTMEVEGKQQMEGGQKQEDIQK